jgi:hypothetical protein
MTIILCIFLYLVPLRCDAMSLQPAGANIDAERQEVVRFLDDLASTPTQTQGQAGDYAAFNGTESGNDSGPMPSTMPTLPVAVLHGVRGRHTLDFRDASQSPCSVNETLQVMTAVAGIAGESIGSPSQASMAQGLQSYGGQLAASPNSSLSAQGGLMQEEAAAVNLGDGESAQSLAAAMQNLPQEDSAGLTPSPSDEAWSADLQQIGQQAAQTAESSFSQAALQALGSWLQSEGGGSSSGSGSTSFLTPILASVIGGGRNVSGASNMGSTGGAFSGQSLGAGGTGRQAAVGGGQNGGGLGMPLAAPSGGANVPVNPGDGSASGGALPATGL